MSILYDITHGNAVQPPSSDFFSRLQNFANTLNGNPEQIVRSLLANGRMSQAQFNNLSNQATQIQQLMSRFLIN